MGIDNLESGLGRGDLVCLKKSDGCLYCLHFFGVSSEGAEFRQGLPYSSHNSGLFVDLSSGRVAGSPEVVVDYEVIKKFEDFHVPYKK